MRAVVIHGASSSQLHVNRCFKHLICSVIFFQIEIYLHKFSYLSPSSSRCKAISMCFKMLVN